MSTERDPADLLPELERKVFDVVLTSGPASVAEVADVLAQQGRHLAYTTVMTILGRIWEKGFLSRERHGRAYFYKARATDQIGEDLAAEAAKRTLERYGERAIAGFLATLSNDQRALLARLLEQDDGDGERGTAQ